MQKPGKDQNLYDQKQILREEFLEELKAFEASPPVAKESAGVAAEETEVH